MRREDQERILTEVQSRVVEARARASDGGGTSLQEVIADSIYHERRRLKDDTSATARAKKADRAFWSDVHHRLNHSSSRELQTLLRTIVGRYADEVCGNFDPRVYRVATSLLPTGLGLLLNTISPKRMIQRLPRPPSIDDSLIIQGETEHLRRLQELGTVIFTPTHVSNLDSVILGYAIYRLGLPPLIYGAGLNLFSNPLTGFFMRNLGAYTVDRRKQDPLYKEVLKEYATLTLEYGYDNLFFPGGTRCRSGAIERKLKLGLLGTSIAAYVNNLRRSAETPKIFIVPATLSFQLTLEAETLAEDFLKEVGKSRYIITDDEFSRPHRVYDFVDQLMGLDSRIYLTISRGLDPFGNPVDENGESLDPRGRRIDPSRYVLVDGEPRVLPQRDREYTRELGERIADSFARDNVIQSTHLTARAAFALLRRTNPGVDLIRLLRVGGNRDSLELRELYREARRLLEELRGLERRGGIRLARNVKREEAEDVITDGLRHFAIFHRTAPLERRGDRVFALERNLLFYYQNRLEGYRFERETGLPPALADDHLSLRSAA